MKSLFTALLFILILPQFIPAETFTRTIDGRELTFEELYYEDFAETLENWLPEGTAEITQERGRLLVDARGGMTTIWCRKEFSGPQLVEYDVRLMPASLESNINMFLLAGKPDAAGVIATSGERDGAYGQYHTFPNYLITVLNGPSIEKREQLRVRMRLNPGFKLVEEAWDEPLIFGKVYHIAYLIEPPQVTVLIDGEVKCTAVYDDKLYSGLHGLRIWQTYSIYDNFRVSRIIEESGYPVRSANVDKRT